MTDLEKEVRAMKRVVEAGAVLYEQYAGKSHDDMTEAEIRFEATYCEYLNGYPELPIEEIDLGNDL